MRQRPPLVKFELKDKDAVFQHFKQYAAEGARLTRHKLGEWLQKRYPTQQYIDIHGQKHPSMADTLCKLLWAQLTAGGAQGNSITFPEFCERIEKFANSQDRMDELYFAVLDTLSEKRLTSEGIFKFFN